MTGAGPDDTLPRMATGRRRWSRAFALLAAVFWGFAWFGLIDLLVVVQQDETFHTHYLFESGWGLLYVVLLTVPFCVLVARPGDAVALSQAAVCALAVLVGAVWGWAWPQLVNAVGLVVTVGALAAVAGVRPGVPRRRPDPVVLALAVVALPAAVVYGHPLARNVPVADDVTNGVSHYPMQASLGLAVVGVATLAAWTLSRLPSFTAAFTAIWLGVESVAYPELGGSLGAVGGACAAVWGVLVAVAVEVARRRTPAVAGAAGAEAVAH